MSELRSAFLHVCAIPDYHGEWYHDNYWAKVILYEHGIDTEEDTIFSGVALRRALLNDKFGLVVATNLSTPIHGDNMCRNSKGVACTSARHVVLEDKYLNLSPCASLSVP